MYRLTNLVKTIHLIFLLSTNAIKQRLNMFWPSPTYIACSVDGSQVQTLCSFRNHWGPSFIILCINSKPGLGMDPTRSWCAQTSTGHLSKRKYLRCSYFQVQLWTLLYRPNYEIFWDANFGLGKFALLFDSHTRIFSARQPGMRGKEEEAGEVWRALVETSTITRIQISFSIHPT